MECVVRSSGPEVIGRLDELGLTESLLAEATRSGVEFVLGCTANDPDYLPGILGSGKITRALRDRLIPRGWKVAKVLNQPSTVNKTGTVSIVVAGGNDATGLIEQVLATRSAKGPATSQAISTNLQGSLADIDNSVPRLETVTPRLTWMLLYFIDASREEVRIELSMPSLMDSSGYVCQWSERNILSPLPLNQEPLIDEEDFGDEAIAHVVRKTTTQPA